MADQEPQWAIVDLFGHQRVAGQVSEQQFGGGAFVRVDVPPIGDKPGFTRLFGPTAIYGIAFVTEPVARAAAAQLRPEPISPYDLPQLSAPRAVAAVARDDDYPGF
jgi:hypothetical protein